MNQWSSYHGVQFHDPFVSLRPATHALGWGHRQGDYIRRQLHMVPITSLDFQRPVVRGPRKTPATTQISDRAPHDCLPEDGQTQPTLPCSIQSVASHSRSFTPHQCKQHLELPSLIGNHRENLLFKAPVCQRDPVLPPLNVWIVYLTLSP
jgi:hypothetical protein